ncbi:hypothetical protein ACHQM5_008192 [Ranunculus cassubicifolius]
MVIPSTISLLLLLLLLTPSITTSSPILGLDSFLTQQSHIDPQATNDSFLSLSSSLKRPLSSQPFSHLSTLISSLLSLEVTIPLHIKLVGSFTPESESILSSLISSTHFSDQFHVIGADPHHLTIKHSLHLDVSSSSLTSQIFDAIRSEIDRAVPSLRSSLIGIPFGAVDQIVKLDFEKEKPVHGVYIYLLNLSPQLKPYAYKYGHGDSSPGITKCLGSIWTGKERYIWIDLAAGPVDYGPALSGDGVLPRGEFHPLAALHGGRPKSQKALLADLASLVWSAYEVLLAPSLRIPVPFENSLIVQFIHVHGAEKDSVGLDWKSIERTFMDEANEGGLLLGDQSLKFKTYDVSLSECSICSFAVSRSINSYTSRFLFDNYTLIVSEYLDSKRLHQILSDAEDEIKKAAGVLEEDDFGRVLPVYVFDLDNNKLMLLDRFHQSVAFKDMVIAARTKSMQTVSDYSCNGRHVITQTRELEKSLVGSILQSMWGVAPTHLLWSPRHNSTLVDYTWSIGQTPFGPFSETSSLSFVQKDAARRNVLLTSLNYTIGSAIEVIESISAHGGDRYLLKKGRHTLFLQRWNLLMYKLEKAVSAISHLDFEMALYFYRSSEHDLFAIHSIVYDASQELEASLTCFEDPPIPWLSVSVVGFLILCSIYGCANRDKIFQNKRKQF